MSTSELSSTNPTSDPQPSPTGVDPATRYRAKRESLTNLVRTQKRRDQTVGLIRVGLFLAVVLLVFGALGNSLIPWWSVAVPLVLFVAVVVVHEQISRPGRRAQRALTFYEDGLARVADQGGWIGRGPEGREHLPPEAEHPFAEDVDLFGKGSLYQKLCTARTQAGQRRLADWLLVPAPESELSGRREAILELRDKLDLREDLALLGDDVRAKLDPDALAEWGRLTVAPTPWPIQGLGLILGVVGPVTLLGFLIGGWDALIFLFAALVIVAFERWQDASIRSSTSAVNRMSGELSLLAQMLARLEREPFRSAWLVEALGRLKTEGRPASVEIARLARWVEWLDMRRNQVFAIPAYLMLWRINLGYRIAAWRIRSGGSVSSWLDAIGRFEAACALAGYAFENPDDVMPELVASAEAGPKFEAEGLGHPLLPRSVAVRNDVQLGGERQLILVSGSNMSGKSTLLRAIGCNVVLAQAGAPVRARRLVLSRLALGATLRIQDSLLGGQSRFSAELSRLRMLQQIALEGDPLLLFLLDEILAGTNSHDRRIGAERLIQTFLELGAIGLVTTHDLALAEMADRLAPRACNVHFEDQIIDGQMMFDYTMRPGTIRKSNALQLMRQFGLDV